MFEAYLDFRNNETRALLISQSFDRKFKTLKQAEKFLESRVAGMKAITLQPDIRIYGRIGQNDRLVSTIALF